jgi:hypothetical protein
MRREIALALRGGRERTLFETSKVLGRRPGDIQRTLRQMLAEGVLKADSEGGEPVRGTLFRFNEDEFGDALDEVLADDRPPGQLLGEQRVLTVEATDEADPYSVLGRGDLNGAISWVVEWGGDGELVVGMVQGSPKRVVDQLVRALRDAKMKCKQRRIGELMSGDDLRRRVTAIEYAKELAR